MTTHTGRNNPGIIAKHRRAHTIQKRDAQRIDGKPEGQIKLKHWPARQRYYARAFGDLLDARIAQLQQPTPEQSEGKDTTPARETPQDAQPFDLKEFKKTHTFIPLSTIPQRLKMGTPEAIAALPEVAGMMSMLPSQFKNFDPEHPDTGRAMAGALWHMMTFCLDTLGAMPLALIDDGSFTSVAKVQRAKLDSLITTLAKKDAKV